METNGVWIVVQNWRGYDESTMAIFPGDQELEARRFSDEKGYGDVVFASFGEVTR
jgi:hypothetical protein